MGLNEQIKKIMNDGKSLKLSYGEYVIYNREWLLKNLETEFDILSRQKKYSVNEDDGK